MRKQTKLVAVLSAAALLAIGASMTSFAAAPHWDREGDEWVYLDRNGDKVTDEWKKSNGQWYYLDSDGYMAKDLVIDGDSDNIKYYVDGSGARVSNAWVSMDNDDLLDDSDEEIDTVWMYFDSNGKALHDTKKQLPYGDGQTGYFIFDEEGYMLSGWRKWSKGGDEEKNQLYYLGDQNEGWAATGWKYLPVDPEVGVFEGIEETDDMYTEESWFYFKTDGKAVRNKPAETIDGKKYAFDEYGRMLDLWVASNPDAEGNKHYTNDADASSSDAESFYREGDGDRVKGDWVQAYRKSYYDASEDDLRWFYVKKNGDLIKAANDAAGATKMTGDQEKEDSDLYSGRVVLSVISGQTYLFNNKGVMLSGVYKLGKDVKKGTTAIGEKAAGIYYFNTESGSVTGQMVKGKKVTIEVDGEDKTYNFKKSGQAYTSAIVSDLLYDHNGQLVNNTFGDGTKYELVKISQVIAPNEEGKYVLTGKNDRSYTFDENDLIAINGNGKILSGGKKKKDYNENEFNVTDYKAEYVENEGK